MMPAALEGTIKAMYIMGENPMLSDPDVTHVEEALEKLDFLVVQDIFLTETAKLADVVLPATSFAERDGTFTNTERRVQLHAAGRAAARARRAATGRSSATSPRRIGYPMDYASTAAIDAEMRALTPSYAGISHARLEAGDSCTGPARPRTTRARRSCTAKSSRAAWASSMPSSTSRRPRKPTRVPVVLTTGPDARALPHGHDDAAQQGPGRPGPRAVRRR